MTKVGTKYPPRPSFASSRKYFRLCSLAKLPCSMDTAPHSSARLTASSVYACAAQYTPAFRASSQMIRNSSSENCNCSSLSVGLATPPEVMILMNPAPFLASSLTATRHASAPSHTRPIVRLQHSHAPLGSVASPARRKSPWPPVCESALPQKTTCGPLRVRSSRAAARPWSAPPQSRTVVNPRSSMASRIGTVRAYSKLAGIALGMRRFALLAVTCTCESTRPVMSVIPTQSMTRRAGSEGGSVEADESVEGGGGGAERGGGAEGGSPPRPRGSRDDTNAPSVWTSTDAYRAVGGTSS